jgi:hypothetical protein
MAVFKSCVVLFNLSIFDKCFHGGFEELRSAFQFELIMKVKFERVFGYVTSNNIKEK